MWEMGAEAINDAPHEKKQTFPRAKIAITDKDMPLAFNEDRHLENVDEIDGNTHTWKMKERMKTVSVALVLCLNLEVDPPDVVKTQPCARVECWIDPMSMSAPKALEKIGQALQAQYERWQPRARYKQSLDPTADEVKKLCLSLRKNAKEERVLFHYNGHGVPKPTVNGEIWVFNRAYTQYIPLSIYDLQTWMGAPSIYVYDCSNAGIIVESFKTFAAQHESEYNQAMSSASQRDRLQSPPSYHNCIQLAACAANQNLPMNPQLPADLFTACLTTPIKIALRWFVLQSTSKLMPHVTLDMVDKVPGKIPDRRTMLGELNWIFTAITDTIAWNTLPRDLFQKLFRQDLLVASLFRNFLLADRIMRSCDCTPISFPALPSTAQHSMWASWDLVLDLCLRQLPSVAVNEAPFKHLPFFEEQLTAFQVWLELGSKQRRPPEQLPIVLQVLLSQVHRTRALDLLGRFLDLGPWAVNMALSVGIYPYILKLLQSFSRELRPLLVYIWAKILAVDNSYQADIIREQGHKYFLSVLQDPSVDAECRTQATFVLSCLVSDYRDGQEAALQGSLLSTCLEQLNDPNAQLRKWVAVCLGRLWDHYESARWTGVRDTAHEKLYTLLKDPCPEVRAASVYALGTFINSVSRRSEHANNIDHAVAMTLVNHAGADASPLVRKELIGALQWLLLAFDVAFVAVASKESQTTAEPPTSYQTLPRIATRERLGQQQTAGTFRRIPSSPSISQPVSGGGAGGGGMTASYSGSLGTLPGLGYGSVYMKIWTALGQLEADPHPDVSRMCCAVTESIRKLVRERDPVDGRANSSVSLPPSPNRGAFLSSESPPTLHPCPGDFHKYSRSSTAANNRKQRRNGDDGDPGARKPLATTNFIAWSSRQFVQPKRGGAYSDKESPRYFERDWRRTRNKNIRSEASEEQRRAITSRIETQVFHTRTAAAPSLLQLHPFNQQIAVAGNDSFAIWDWGTGAKTTVLQQRSATGRVAKIGALEWVNGHDVALLMVTADDGSVRVWRPNVGTPREPTLVTAWQAFADFKPRRSGLLLAWEQWTRTVVTSGDAKVLRFWDAEKELRAFDIPTGTDASVTCIDSSHSGSEASDRRLGDEGPRSGFALAGFENGSVRLFDRRCGPQDSRVKVWMEHPAPVLAVQLKDDLVISGSCAGDVKIYDVRKNDSLHTNAAVQGGGGMSCMSIHRNANTYACGSSGQFISIYTLNGTPLNTIRFYEGFMGHRIGPVSCLNFHAHKVVLAAGTSDCCVNVYSLESARR
ncbi:regulatory-associated protein of mTOR [Cylas formicarius]|uniref:regulatory-associated protein of mTOR n=1 Tax=Cylas formicarius TaxID=197179 RepID=UPI002958AC7C|nr:regulatory-associated protein of mTOR [Cylas formicarius]